MYLWQWHWRRGNAWQGNAQLLGELSGHGGITELLHVFILWRWLAQISNSSCFWNYLYTQSSVPICSNATLVSYSFCSQGVRAYSMIYLTCWEFSLLPQGLEEVILHTGLLNVVLVRDLVTTSIQTLVLWSVSRPTSARGWVKRDSSSSCRNSLMGELHWWNSHMSTCQVAPTVDAEDTYMMSYIWEMLHTIPLPRDIQGTYSILSKWIKDPEKSWSEKLPCLSLSPSSPLRFCSLWCTRIISYQYSMEWLSVAQIVLWKCYFGTLQRSAASRDAQNEPLGCPRGIYLSYFLFTFIIIFAVLWYTC